MDKKVFLWIGKVQTNVKNHTKMMISIVISWISHKNLFQSVVPENIFPKPCCTLRHKIQHWFRKVMKTAFFWTQMYSNLQRIRYQTTINPIKIAVSYTSKNELNFWILCFSTCTLRHVFVRYVTVLSYEDMVPCKLLQPKLWY